MAISKTTCIIPSSCKVKATHRNPKNHASNLSVSRRLMDELSRRNSLRIMTQPYSPYHIDRNTTDSAINCDEHSNLKVVQEMHAILEIVGDRADMHKNIGQQRDNWNRLLLDSINRMTVTAAIMAGLATVSADGSPILALKLSSTMLYTAATGILIVMNKIQPLQLAEEQRNASRLFKQLHEEIQGTLAYRDPSPKDVKNAMQKSLALDKAFPLPLLGAMLDNKFPKVVEPAVWWCPKEEKSHEEMAGERKRTGWSGNLEEEMRNINVETLKRKDGADYMRLCEIGNKVNKIFAICGPLFTGCAALGSAFMGSTVYGSWAAPFGFIFGSLATVINTLEHGGQAGMMFEMHKSSAGFLKHLEDNIESTLKEKEFSQREDGDFFEK